MSDNRAIVERMFEEMINQGRVELIDELFAPEFTSEAAGQGTMDRESFRAFVSGWQGGFSDLHTTVGDFVVEGDRVAWSVRATGVHTGEFMGIPATGRAIDIDSLNVGEFRDGRAVRHKLVMDVLTMMQQLGVIPTAP